MNMTVPAALVDRNIATKNIMRLMTMITVTVMDTNIPIMALVIRMRPRISTSHSKSASC